MLQKKYDYTFDNKFSTYAVNWINQYIQRGIDKEISAIRIPSKKDLRGLQTIQFFPLIKLWEKTGTLYLAISYLMKARKIRSRIFIAMISVK